MTIITRRDPLQQAIATAARAVSSRSTLPILSHILLEAEGERLAVSATDLEYGVRTELQVEVEEPGRSTLLARLLGEVVSTQSSTAPLQLTINEQDHATFTCGKSVMEVHGLPAAEFPPLPAISGGTALTVPQAALKRMIQQCILAVSTDDTRARLTGVLVTIGEGRIRLVATDTHRLATAAAELPAPAESISVIVPARTMREVERLLSSDDAEATVAIQVAESQLQFTFEQGVTIFSRLIDGEFPNYRKVIPTGHEWVISGPVASLRESVRRCAIISREDNRKLIVRATPGGQLKLSAQSSKIGSAAEEVEGLLVQAEGQTEPLEIAFNADYLLDILTHLDSDELRIELKAANQPAAIRPVAEEDYVYVLMPMQLV